eukprot:jgi/Mesvir1/13933/Mv16054-RA.1
MGIYGCPAGWTPDTAGGCLHQINITGEYDTQVAACAALWTAYPVWNIPHLVKITSSEVNDAAKALCSGPTQCYIGLASPMAVPATFVWHDGSAATYFNWGGSEPVDLGGNVNGYNYAYIVGPSDGSWHMTPPTALLGAICQIDAYCEVNAHCRPDKVCVDNRCVECATSEECTDDEFCYSDYTCMHIETGCPADWLSTSAAGCLHLVSNHSSVSYQAEECVRLWPGFPDGNVGHLAKITGSTANADVRAVCHLQITDVDKCYIGLSDAAVEGTYLWSDNTPAVYQNLASGQGSAPDYAAIDPDDGKWYLYGATDNKPAVCQIDPFCFKDTHCDERQVCVDGACVDCRENKDCPRGSVCIANGCVVIYDGCPEGFSFFRYAGCLQFLPSPDTYTNQVVACDATWRSAYPNDTNTPHLVTITREAVNAAVMVVCGSDYCFIGLSDAAIEGQYVWQDGTEVSYTNWGFRQPSVTTAGKDYAVLGSEDGLWRMMDGSYAAVCQINSFCVYDEDCAPGLHCIEGSCFECAESCNYGGDYGGGGYVGGLRRLTEHCEESWRCSYDIGVCDDGFCDLSVGRYIVHCKNQLAISCHGYTLADAKVLGRYFGPITGGQKPHRPPTIESPSDCGFVTVSSLGKASQVLLWHHVRPWPQLVLSGGCECVRHHVNCTDTKQNAKLPGTAPVILAPCASVANAWGWVDSGQLGCLQFLPADTWDNQVDACGVAWPSAYPGGTNVGNLVKIPDIALSLEVAAVCPLNSRCYIGLSDAATQRVYAWQDGTVASNTNWAAGEPSTAAGKDYGTVMRTDGADNGQWSMASGNVPLGAICQISKFCVANSQCLPVVEVCKSGGFCGECVAHSECGLGKLCIAGSCFEVLNGCPDGWTSYGDTTCLRLTSGGERSDSVTECGNMWPSGFPSSNTPHLVKITSSDMNAFVAALCPGNCFTGLTYMEGLGSYIRLAR